DDYEIYLHIANVPVVSVNPDSPYDNFGALLEAMKGGERVTVATAGVNSSGGMALAAIREAAGGDTNAQMIAYDGGNPAVLAAASGEALATTQLASEQAELIRAGKLRPLVALAATPLEIEGIDPIPPITEYMEMHTAPDYFGVFIPKGAPQEVYDTVNRVWQDAIMDAQELKDYAKNRGATFDPAYGEAAREKAMPVVIAEACARVTRNEAVLDPSEIGIDCSGT
ncbi:MAG: tripartite tricarboxylate transporter substrate-binding protein, partial [Pseudomonadota bacterium]